uniref:Putative arabinosyltransferase ARAD1 isoform X2 n=1 Tax=Rhizophora mucronata TaxID=61149 RepID=A0A2P2QNU4_RHIMU
MLVDDAAGEHFRQIVHVNLHFNSVIVIVTAVVINPVATFQQFLGKIRKPFSGKHSREERRGRRGSRVHKKVEEGVDDEDEEGRENQSLLVKRRFSHH